MIKKEIAKEDYNCQYCGYPIYKGESMYINENTENITCSKTCQEHLKDAETYAEKYRRLETENMSYKVEFKGFLQDVCREFTTQQEALQWIRQCGREKTATIEEVIK